MYKLKPKDLIAVIIIAGFLMLVYTGRSSHIEAWLPLIVGYYFGHRTTGTDTGH